MKLAEALDIGLQWRSVATAAPVLVEKSDSVLRLRKRQLG
jgi:hypothetical protein